MRIYASHETAVRQMLGDPARFQPNDENSKIYERIALRRNKLYNALNDADVYDAFMGAV